MYNSVPKAVLERRRFLGLLAAFGAAGVAGLNFGQAKAAGQVSKELVVVELFTSQGCNSCPPADAFLDELAEQENILALSFPVDYWDYLGWKDTLADPAHTARQTAYRQSFGLRQIYTPQMVIQGRREGVGSRTRDIQAKIAGIQDTGVSQAGLTITMDADSYEVTVSPKNGFAGKAGVWIVYYDPVHEVDVKAGENSGRVLRYRNVVRAMTPLGAWSGAENTFTIAKADMVGKGEKCAVVVQADDAGPILGAALMP